MKRLVGLLGWIGVALVVASLVVRATQPEHQLLSRQLAYGGLVVTILYALTQWRDIARSLSGRNVKYGSVAAVGVIVMLGVLVAVNWIASRQNKRWDLTETSQFSLSEQTRQILTELDQPVRIQVFYTETAQPYRDRLTEYSYISNKVSVEYVDADRNPLEAQNAEIETVPTLIIDYAGRTERATSAEEQAVTNALKKLIEGKAKKLYFVQGHGEHDPTASTAEGYSAVADALKNDNFEVANLTLAQAGSVPDDASVVVVAGPRTDLLAGEADALRAFLKRGGKVHLMIDPPDKGASLELPNVLALAREWGMELGNNLVVDASGIGRMLGTDASVPVAMPVQHPITNNFRVMTAFPLARSVTPIEGGSGGHTAQKIIETSPQSWGETDIAGLYATGQPEPNTDRGDQTGPLSLAAAASAAAPDAPAPAEPDAPKPETRVVVVGDSDFASNRYIGLQGNRELFLNMSNWLAQQEDLIAIRPRDPQSRPIEMTADQGLMVYWFTMGILPLLFFLNGVRVWWKRR